MAIEKYPNELELLEFFEVEPEPVDTWEGIFVYRVIDSNELVLQFSFSIFEGWIQALLEYKGMLVQQSLTENVRAFEVRDKNHIYTEVFANGAVTKVEITVKPRILIRWNTLINEFEP